MSQDWIREIKNSCQIRLCETLQNQSFVRQNDLTLMEIEFLRGFYCFSHFWMLEVNNKLNVCFELDELDGQS